MRVSIDARYVRERPSGIGAYVQALVEHLPGLAPEDHFHLWRNPRGPTRLSAAGNASHSTVRAGANSLPTLLAPSRLADLRQVDVLHAPFNILGYGLDCAAVTTIHDLMWMTDPTLCEGRSLASPLFARFYQAGIRQALRRSARLIAISHATADVITRLSPEAVDRVRVIHHGLAPRFTPAEPDPGALRRLGIPGDYLLVVGQNTPSKNHAAVLEAFAAADLPRSVSLVLLQRLYQRGRFGLSRRSTLAPVAERLGISDRVVWLSGLRDGEVLDLLRGAMALVQYSRYEGFGMPALEAAACGTPVVASDIPPLVEVLGGAGLHATLDPASLTRALRRIVREPSLRADLRAAGLERARHFCWRRCAERHLEVYREAAGNVCVRRGSGGPGGP